MIPIPAIDLLEGRCVRLLRGDFSNETVYGDPVEQAHLYAADGAPMLHVVDLDAARSGTAANDVIVREIIERVDLPIQVGGGVRTAARAEWLLAFGARRVVVGTLAVEDPRAACALAERFPGQIVVGLDHRTELIDGIATRLVATRGWETSAGVELAKALSLLEGAPFAGTVITDISRDGTLTGPDLDGCRYALGSTSLEIIASGGVGTIADLVALRDLEVDGRSVAGVVIGRALLSGAFTVADAVAACAR